MGVPAEEHPTKLVQSRKPTNTVDATFIRGQVPASIGKEASSMWPADIEVTVPESWKEGEKVPAQGPHGLVLFDLPEGCKPWSWYPRMPRRATLFASPCQARQASSGFLRLSQRSLSLVSTSLRACRLPTAWLAMRARGCPRLRQRQRRPLRDRRAQMQALVAARTAMLCEGGSVPVPVAETHAWILDTHLSQPSARIGERLEL